MLDFAIFAVTFLVILVGAIVWLYPNSKIVTTIPGLVPTSKEDGNLADIRRIGSLHEFLMDLHGQFGPITGFWWGSTYMVSIASPQLFKAHSHVFDRPPELFKLYEALVTSRSIQYANGSEGRKRRSQYDRVFIHEHLHKYYPSMQKMADVVVKRWSKKGPQDHNGLSEDMFLYSINSGLTCLFGEHFEDEKLAVSVSNAYSKVWSEMERRILSNSVQDEENTAVHKSFDEALNYLRTTIKKVIQLRGEKGYRKENKLLIDIIMDNTTDEDILLADTITYMAGSIHTMANLLTWCLYFLATHKDVQDKLHKEIETILGENEIISDSNYGQFRYMLQVIDETLRCAVVAPITVRFQDFDSELGGHKVPKNTPVIHALGVVQQDETIFPMPQKFDPDRFSIENIKNRSTFAFSPFGFAGKRICPAYKFAYREAAVLLASVLKRFEVSMWEDQVVHPQYGLVSHPIDEIWVKVTKRK